jgi:3-hydroxyacyl-[acyl-carrier-protein] dehydratase
MRFRQLDLVTHVAPGDEIRAVRAVAAHEGYFRDHFPNFPVLPGVLMVEAMFQACQWLVRASEDFAHAVVLLREARNLKFSGLVRPGQTLDVSARIKKQDAGSTTLAAEVLVDGAAVAGGRLVLERFNLADRYPARAGTDASLRSRMRAEWQRLQPGPAAAPAMASGFRWMWIDRFVEFVDRQRAVAIKNVTMTDEPIDLYQPGFPVLPCALILEGIAQTGGILVGACHEFEKRIVLAKITRAVFHRPAVPGDTLTFTTEILDMQPEGSLVRGTSHAGPELQAEVECFFAYLAEDVFSQALIGPVDVLEMLRLYGLFEVARRQDGSPFHVPPRMLAAAQAREPIGAESGEHGAAGATSRS